MENFLHAVEEVNCNYVAYGGLWIMQSIEVSIITLYPNLEK